MSSQTLWLVVVVVGLLALGVLGLQRRRSNGGQRPKAQQSGARISSAGADEHAHISLADSKRPDHNRLNKSQSVIGVALSKVFAAQTDTAWQELEDSLIMADAGADVARDLVNKIRSAYKSGQPDVKLAATRVLTDVVDGGYVRNLNVERHDDLPAVILMVGVNGTGKTTTTGKLAHLLTQRNSDVLLAAADTFRAAAAEQLSTWGERIGVPVVRGVEGADPASVAFEATNAGIEHEVDVVLIDTAGRLHTKQGLMDELGKVYRVVSKVAAITEVLLVIDATTGQNGLAQAKVFSEVVPLTGIVLTKLDGTAKGGIVIAVQNELQVPVKLVGLGEGINDLVAFEPSDFIEGLISQ